MKKYEKPMAFEIDMTSVNMVATSGLQYTGESADKDSPVLSGKNHGEWGNLWK